MYYNGCFYQNKLLWTLGVKCDYYNPNGVWNTPPQVFLMMVALVEFLQMGWFGWIIGAGWILMCTRRTRNNDTKCFEHLAGRYTVSKFIQTNILTAVLILRSEFKWKWSTLQINWEMGETVRTSLCKMMWPGEKFFTPSPGRSLCKCLISLIDTLELNV